MPVYKVTYEVSLYAYADNAAEAESVADHYFEDEVDTKEHISTQVITSEKDLPNDDANSIPWSKDLVINETIAELFLKNRAKLRCAYSVHVWYSCIMVYVIQAIANGTTETYVYTNKYDALIEFDRYIVSNARPTNTGRAFLFEASPGEIVENSTLIKSQNLL